MRYLLLSLFVLGCPKDEVLPVELVKFEASAAQVQAGAGVMLSWELRNSASVMITATPGGAVPGVAGDVGTVTSPALDEPTTFQLTAMGADGSRVMSDPVRVDVRGIRISTFRATPESVGVGESSTLEWAIGGDAPTDVTITDSAAIELYSGIEPSGTLVVNPAKTEVYTLAVTAESGTDEAMVTVMVADLPPIIVSFTAVQNPVAIGEFAELRWETLGAQEVQVLKGATVRRPWNRQGAQMGSVSLEVDAVTVEFTLQARTATMMMSEMTIMVTGLAVPSLTQFDLSPTEYTQASTVATVTWATTNTDSVELEVNGTLDMAFPGTLSGSHSFNVTGLANVTLTATNQVGEDRQTRRVSLGFMEQEPNDTSTTAIALAGDGLPVRGTILPGDVDVYAVMVPEGARITAIVGYNEDTMACSFDTVLELHDTGQLLGSVDDSPGIAPCSQIHPAVHGFADNLSAGVYFIHVRGATGGAAGAGTYSLEVAVLLPSPPLAGVTRTPIGNPLFTIEDVQQVSVLIGNGNSNPAYRFFDGTMMGIFQPLYSFYDIVGDPAGIHIVHVPDVANQRDYSTVLSALFSVAGYTNKTTFTRAEFEADNALWVSFTLVPAPGAPMEDSFDFALGPVLRTELFPMSFEWDIARDAAPWYDSALFDFPGYHQLMPPVPGSGSSHRVVSTVIIDALAMMGEDAAGSYEQVVTLTDAGGQGWTLTIPFTVMP